MTNSPPFYIILVGRTAKIEERAGIPCGAALTCARRIVMADENKILWINNDEKIVCFTENDGYRPCEFRNTNSWWDFVRQLIDLGYKFK